MTNKHALTVLELRVLIEFPIPERFPCNLYDECPFLPTHSPMTKRVGACAQNAIYRNA